MADAEHASPPRLSRYRSVRASQHSPPTSSSATPPPLPPPQSQDPSQEVRLSEDAFARSRSRYKRGNASIEPPHPSTPRDVTRQANTQLPSANPPPESPVPHKNNPPVRSGHDAEPRARPPSSRRLDQPSSIDKEEQIQRMGTRTATRQTQDPSPNLATTLPHTKQPSVTDLFPPPRPVAEPLPLQKRATNGPPKSGEIRATKSMSNLAQYQNDDEEEDGAGCFGLFKRKRADAPPMPNVNTRAMPAAVAAVRPATSREKTIKVGGGGAVPGTDAPVSAVNTGDRRVLVECGNSKTLFPVTPTTNPIDIIKSASICMSERIDVKSAILFESFGSVGVQRPLRRYEHVRDVMNSWDNDSENSLLLMNVGTGESDAELSVAGAPKEKPGDASWVMIFSQKPGKWEKRVVTLRSDGQITMQKDIAKEKDLSNVCHLSDFDIYEPTPEKARKKIKPPKRFCYAIKSQQKTSMFESTQNFVHFFCTGDKSTADAFHRAIHGWRSWYLVNVLGEGKKLKLAEDRVGEQGLIHSAGGRDRAKAQHRTQDSTDSHYQLGSFQPLQLDVDEFEKDISVEKQESTARTPITPIDGFTKSSNSITASNAPERRTSRARKQPPSSSRVRGAHLADDEPLANFGQRNSIHRRRTSLEQSQDSVGEFASGGLLGRTYSQRQREHLERESPAVQPFSSGPTLLSTGFDNDSPVNDSPSDAQYSDAFPRRNPSTRVRDANRAIGNHSSVSSGELKRNSSRRAAGGSGPTTANLQRTSSQRREKPQPLIDLTPTYREPPQHIRKGRAFRPPPEDNSGPLIESATSPEDPLGIPASSAWRARPPGAGLLSTAAPPTQRVSPAVEASRIAARNGGATGPLLDVTDPDEFAPGTLLNRVARAQPNVPLIDRSKDPVD